MLANGVSGQPQWSTKTFLEICKDIRTAIVALRTQSQDTIDPEKLDLTLAIATSSVDWLSTTSDFGISVRDWLKEAYPRIRVVSAPQLNAAYSSDNVFYLYADKIDAYVHRWRLSSYIACTYEIPGTRRSAACKSL